MLGGVRHGTKRAGTNWTCDDLALGRVIWDQLSRVPPSNQYRVPSPQNVFNITSKRQGLIG